MGVSAQTVVPEVSVRKHALLDLYAYGAGTVNIHHEICSLVDRDCEKLLSLGATVGMGVGFHMPNGLWRYMLRVGYHYQNITYFGHYHEKGINLNYLNIDARVSLYTWLVFGIRSNVLLTQSLPSDLPQVYYGYNIACFNPATLTPYMGFGVPVSSNLSMDFIWGFEALPMLNAKQVKSSLLEYGDYYGQFCFEVGFTYRLFTSGKRQAWK